jgi:predicted MFS family arabinose efflux permease
MLANLLFGLSTMPTFSLAVTMLTEFIPHKPSAGVAVANFLRNILSCLGSAVGNPLIRAVGNGWLFTGLAVIACSGMGVVWSMRRHRERWREGMDRLEGRVG